MKAKGILMMYIGLSDDANEGTWTWTDGRELSFTSWHIGQPDNYRNQQDCVTIDRQRGGDPLNRSWDDSSCYHSRAFTCQMRPV